MEQMNLLGKWVLVTGASSGLGSGMARVLADRHRANVILAARREDRLRQLSDELQRSHGVQVDVFPVDLTNDDAIEKLIEYALHRQVAAAVLNAGVTHFGPYEELSYESFKRMLQINVTSVVHLATRLIPTMRTRDEGGAILLVSSLAGIVPVPYQSAYSGTKAFLVAFGTNLHEELRSSGVTVTTYAPAGIATEMTAGTRFDDLRGWLMPVDKCAQEGIDALVDHRNLYIPGFVNQAGSWLGRALPRGLVASVVGSRYRAALRKSG